jgi:nucleoside-diphosphate-sugar epimerase
MLIAITGATGFIGRFIINHLLQAGHRCRCWYRGYSDRGGYVDEDRIQWIRGSLDDVQATDPLVLGADAVIHAALARPGMDGDVAGFAQINVVGSLRLMQAARKAGVDRFVFISTCAVHDVILEDRTLDESHPLWPRSHYGAHKAAIEKFVHSFGLGEGWPVCALRPTGVYGPRRPAERSKWYALVQDVCAGQAVHSGAGGKEVHAADVARAVQVLLEAPPAAVAGQAFNCYDLYVSDEQVARIAREICGSSSKISDSNHGPRHQIDTTRLRAMGMRFGGEAQLRDYVRHLVNAVRRG